jgi:hypothetical protein
VFSLKAVRYLSLILFATSAAYGQIGSDRVRTLQTRTPSGSSTSQVVRNANGRTVPVSRVEDKIVSDTGGVKIIERTIQQFDPSGNPLPPDKERIEIRKEADGSENTITTVRRADVNGTLQVAERRTQIARKSGNETNIATTVERPTANAGFAVVEKSEQQERSVGAGRSSTSATTWQRDPNGRLVEVNKRTAERTTEGEKSVENAAEYESTSTGQMRLMRQTVTRSDAARTEVDVFETQAAGRAASSDTRPQLAKRQVIERILRPAGVVESISVQFPVGNDSNRLTPLQKVEERVCEGNCGQ